MDLSLMFLTFSRVLLAIFNLTEFQRLQFILIIYINKNEKNRIKWKNAYCYYNKEYQQSSYNLLDLNLNKECNQYQLYWMSLCFSRVKS